MTEQEIRDAMRERLTPFIALSGLMTEEEALKNARKIMSPGIELMRNRLVVGSYRYQQRRNTGIRFNHIESIKARLEQYMDTGNQEHLIDAANLCLVEFTYPDCHPEPYFKAEDDGSHAQEIK